MCVPVCLILSMRDMSILMPWWLILFILKWTCIDTHNLDCSHRSQNPCLCKKYKLVFCFLKIRLNLFHANISIFMYILSSWSNKNISSPFPSTLWSGAGAFFSHTPHVTWGLEMGCCSHCKDKALNSPPYTCCPPRVFSVQEATKIATRLFKSKL